MWAKAKAKARAALLDDAGHGASEIGSASDAEEGSVAVVPPQDSSDAVKYPPPPLPVAPDPTELDGLAWSDQEVERYLVTPLREIDAYRGEAYVNPDSPYGWNWREQFVAKGSEADVSGLGRENNLARLLQPGEDNDKGHPDDTLTGKAIVHPDVHKALHCHALARLALDGALQDMLWLKKEVDNLSSSESKTSVEGPPSVVVPKISLDLTVDLVGLCFRGEKTQVMMKRPAAGVEGAMTVMRRPAGAAATMMRRPAAAFGYVDYRGDNDSDISESEGDDDNPGDEQTPQAPQEDRFVNSTVVFDRNAEFIWPWLQHVRHTWSSGGRLDSVFPVGYRTPLNLLLANMMNEIAEVHLAARRKAASLDVVPAQEEEAAETSGLGGHVVESRRYSTIPDFPDARRMRTDVYASAELGGEVEEVDGAAEVKDLLIRKTKPYELVTWLVSQPELRGFLPLLCRSQLERVQATLARTIEELEGTTDPVRARDKTAAERAFHAFQEMALNSLQPYRYLDTRGKVVEALRRALQVQTLYLQMQIASSFAFGFHRGTAAVALKDEHGDSYAYPSLLDRPELLEATVTAARKRFAELGRTTLVAGPGGEGQARGHQVDPHPDSMMAELLRGVSLVALFGHQAGRKPKVAQFFVKEWLDELKQAAAAPGAHVGVEVDAIAFAKYVNDYPRGDVEHILSVSPSEYNVRLPRNELNLNQVVGFFPRHNITGRYDRGLSPSMNLLQYWATQHNPELEGTRHGYIPPEIMLQMLRGKHANSFRFSSDSATVTSLRRYEALSLLVDKWGLPLWRPKWTQEGDITVAGEVCRWIDMEQSEDEDDDSVPDRRTPRSDRLEAYLLLHDEVDEYRGRHSVSVDEQDRSSTNRSPKCDAVLVHAAVHNQAQHFFNRTSTDEEEEPKRIENEIEIDSPFYDHEAWKQAEKASYERRGPFGGPAADRLRSLYSGVQIMRAAAAGSAVREAALLLAFGEKPATEDEVLLEALLSPWGAAGTLAKAEREAEREALLEKVKAVSRARRGRAHWHAADNHRGDHGALTAPTYQVLHSQVLRLLNILPKWAPDLSVAELKKKSFLTDVELARLLLALREDVARQPDAFWVGEGAADSVAAHLLDPGQVIYQVLFTDHSTHEKVVANSLQANVMKDDVQKQREFMKVEVLRYLDELLRVRGEEGTAMSIFYEDSEDLPDLATGRSRNNGSDSKKGSSVVRELFPGPLEAGSREAKPDRKPREMPSIFLRRTDAELVALLYVFYTKQREQAGAHDLAERQGSVEQKPEGVSEPLPDGFTALVRVILENQNEYWAEHSSHGNGLTNPSCVDGRIERLQISLIGRVTLPEDPSRWKLMKNTGELQLLHFLSDLFANSLERSQAEKRVSAAGGAAKVYPALQQHEVHADLWREDTLLFARLATIAAANDDSRSLDQEKQEVPSANSTSNQEQKKALAAESYLFLIDHQTPSRNRVREDSVDENAISELERVQEPQDEAAAGEEDPATKLARKLGVSTKQDRAEVEEKLGKFTRLVDAIVRSLLSMENAGKISEWVRVEQ
eukprot:g16336.t1